MDRGWGVPAGGWGVPAGRGGVFPLGRPGALWAAWGCSGGTWVPPACSGAVCGAAGRLLSHGYVEDWDCCVQALAAAGAGSG